jgi:hypothetical protein
LNETEADKLVILMTDWFLEFYRTGAEAKTAGELGQRLLTGRRRDARNIYTEIVFVRQEVIYAESGAPMNEIVYNQRLVYEDPIGLKVDFEEDLNTTANEEVDNSINIDDLVPGEIAVMPFEDFDANLDLSTTMTENIESLKAVQIPLPVPVIPAQEQEQLLTVEQGREERWRPSSVASSAMIVTLGFMVSAGGFHLYNRRLARMKYY